MGFVCIFFFTLQTEKLMFFVFFAGIYCSQEVFYFAQRKRGMHLLPQAGKMLVVFCDFFGEKKRRKHHGVLPRKRHPAVGVGWLGKCLDGLFSGEPNQI